eukprot:jgi/Chlat1/3218/Chrsp22S03499
MAAVAVSPPPATATAPREERYAEMHRLYVRGELDACLKLIEEACGPSPPSVPVLLLSAHIRRRQGRVRQSLELFQRAAAVEPGEGAHLKQVARSLYLLGKHRAALAVYDEALALDEDDRESWHCKGLCHTHLQVYDAAEQCFKRANEVRRHEATFAQLGKLYTLQENYKGAIEMYVEALECSPENPDILTTIGLLYLRLGENYRAFDFLGNSLTHDPRNSKTILAAGSIIQDHSDMDVALVKYRVAAVLSPTLSQLWNNIGMCFFGKLRLLASVSCLRRALYLDPFEWIVSYNLGLVHLSTGQYASAFRHLSASIALKPSFASSYMYMAVALARMEDFENACAAYEKALDLESDPLFLLNYSITLALRGDLTAASSRFAEFERLFGQLDEEEARGGDGQMVEMRERMGKVLRESGA